MTGRPEDDVTDETMIDEYLDCALRTRARYARISPHGALCCGIAMPQVRQSYSKRRFIMAYSNVIGAVAFGAGEFSYATIRTRKGDPLKGALLYRDREGNKKMVFCGRLSVARTMYRGACILSRDEEVVPRMEEIISPFKTIQQWGKLVSRAYSRKDAAIFFRERTLQKGSRRRFQVRSQLKVGFEGFETFGEWTLAQVLGMTSEMHPSLAFLRECEYETLAVLRERIEMYPKFGTLTPPSGVGKIPVIQFVTSDGVRCTIFKMGGYRKKYGSPYWHAKLWVPA